MRNKIIEIIYKQSIPEKLANKMWRRFRLNIDKFDYIQEMYLILLEIKEDKLIDLYGQGKLDDYFAQICLNQLTRRSSNFHKKYKTYNSDVTFSDLYKQLVDATEDNIEPEDYFSLDKEDALRNYVEPEDYTEEEKKLYL